MDGLDGLIHSEESYICPYIPAVSCPTGQCSRCHGCENNPETYILDENLRKQFEEHPWAPYCMTCGEFDSIQNHPGHIIAVGFEEYKQKLPEMIMDRLLRKGE